ncbi:MAG: hypothetical protein ABEJ05_06180 [Haloglomus sp.]
MRQTTRRGLLGVLAAGALPTAGCSSTAEGPPDGAVHLFNQTNFSRVVRVRVATAAGESLLDKTFEVPAGGRRTSAIVMTEPGEYEVTATAGADESSRTLSFPAEDDTGGTTGETDILGYVRVAISRDGVLVSRAGLR